MSPQTPVDTESSTTVISGIDSAVLSLKKLPPSPVFRSSYHGGGNGSLIQGTLDSISTLDELTDRLLRTTVVQVPIVTDGIDIYQAYDLDTSLPFSVTKVEVTRLVEGGVLSKDTMVSMRYEHGALQIYLHLDETNRHLFVTRDLWFSYDKKVNEAVAIGTGRYTHLNKLYYQSKYHNLDTTIGKLLASRNGDVISTIHLYPPGYEELADLA